MRNFSKDMCDRCRDIKLNDGSTLSSTLTSMLIHFESPYANQEQIRGVARQFIQATGVCQKCAELIEYEFGC